MRLPVPGEPHLTYCTNIHPGETWRAVRANVERYVVAVKARIAPDRHLGVGLRLSAEAAEALAEPGELAAFRDFLDGNGLYVFTLNGFAFGVFHGTRVKEQVYLPDWLDERRLAYTDRLSELLAALLPAGVALEGSVSTVPGAFRARVAGESDAARMAGLLLRHAATLHRLRERTGKVVSLALEPEPCCYLETIAETVRFFERYLFSPAAVTALTRLTGLSRAESESALHRHLGVCVDTCHMAVEFEEPLEALRALRAAGIRIGKIQLSAGLRVLLDPSDRRVLDALRPFAEGVYLHQVVELRGSRLTRFVNLPDAIEAVGRGGDGPREWRVHFHVPLFRRQLGLFANTQDDLRAVLGLLRREAYSQHLEIETYTWEVLPEEYRREDIVTAVGRELAWVMEHLSG